MRKLQISVLLVALLALQMFMSPLNFASPAVAQTLSLPTAAVPPTSTKAGEFYFAETGHNVPQVFHSYWNRTGSMAIYGLPLTEVFQELNRTDNKHYNVQYFERARFEYHPEQAGSPFEVQLGLLGQLATEGRTFDKVPAFPSTAERWYLPETSHSLFGAFLGYWISRGGVATFGFPISEEVVENGLTVQYFERARFEYHPEQPDPAYQVLLGLLGRNSLEKSGANLSQTFRLETNSENIVQGRTVKVKLIGIEGNAFSGYFDGAPLLFGNENGTLVAYAPIPSNAQFYTRSLIINITDRNGVPRRFSRGIGVQAGYFTSQLLYVTPGVAANIGNAAQQQYERNRFNYFLSQYTSEKLWSGKFIYPCYGRIVTYFGARRNYSGGLGGFEIHDAIDIGIPYDAPIRASARGRVVLSEFQYVRGGLIIIDHGLGVHTTYFHNQQLLVKVGDIVNTGDVIARGGSTGLSTGPHSHWEVKIGTIGVDPNEWVDREL